MKLEKVILKDRQYAIHCNGKRHTLIMFLFHLKRNMVKSNVFYRIPKHLSFADGGLSDYLPGPIKDLDQTGPLTAGKDRIYFHIV